MSSSTIYVDSFLTKKPKEGIHIVQTRLKDAMALDIEMAEYFKERAQIEEEYAKNLSKASKRLYTIDPMILGHFAPTWEALLKEFNQVAKYHSDMAYKITHEVEKPLRSSPSNDYQKLQQLEPMIQSLETKKFPSVKNSILRKSKHSNGNVSWKNEGAEYLSLHQSIDEARLQRLKESVQHFEKIQSEELMNRVNMATTSLSIAESFDIQHDIRDFCSERGRGLTTVHPSANHSNTSLNSSSTPSTTPSAPSPNIIPTPTTSATSDKHSSMFMGRERSSTTVSNDSHRSSNKFKSLFMKKKKSLDQEDFKQQPIYAEMNEAVVSESSPVTSQPIIDTSSSPSQSHQAPLVDAEGFSIPTYNNNNNNLINTASDISSRNTSDDVDSDFQSLKMNQKLNIKIKDDIVQEEATEESFNKMATMLRERTPTISRRPRGRRESAMLRSQTDSQVFNNTSPTVASSQSMISSPTNPFFSADLQSIPESTRPQLSVSIIEKPTMQSPNVLHVTGEIYISYQGTPTAVPLHLNHMDGIQQFTANSEYMTALDDGTYEFSATQPTQEPVPCFTYEFSTSSLALPVRLLPSWKCVDGVTYLMVKYETNNTTTTNLKGAVQVVMHDQHVNQVQSTPQGVWDTAKQQLTWNLKDIFDQPRLLAKFYVEGQGQPQPVYVSYSQSDALVSGITVSSEAVDKVETRVQSEPIVYL